MRWFGSSWGAPVCQDTDHVDGLPSHPCAVCNEPFHEGDQGLLLPFVGSEGDPPELPYHLRCFLKAVGVDRRVV